MPEDVIVYEFSPPKVERGDCSAFIADFVFDCLPTGRRLQAMVPCCLRSFTALSEDGNPNVKVEYDPLELIEFLRRDFAPMNAICERAGVFENLIDARTNAIFHYFGLLPGEPTQP